MVYRFTSVFLSFFLLTSALASSRSIQKSQVMAVLTKTQASPIEVHAKLNQWSDLKTQALELEDKDREVLLKRLEKIEQTPFQKPNIEATPQGFDLVHNKIRIKFDLQKKEISVQEKVFLYETQGLEKTLLWLESLEGARTSFTAWIIPEAHAFVPLLPTAIILLAGAILYLTVPSKKTCLEAVTRAKENVQKVEVECHFASSNPREVPPSLKALIRKSFVITGFNQSRFLSCEDGLKETFSFWGLGSWASCLPKPLISELCGSITYIHNCLNQIQRDRPGLKINSSGREIKKDQHPRPHLDRNTSGGVQH